MLMVFAANDGIQVRLGAASVSPCQIVGSSGRVGDDDSATFQRRAFGFQTAGVAPVEVLTGNGVAPLGCDWLCIKNPNVANVEVILDYEIAGVLREFKRVILAQNETLEYAGGGWRVTTSAGAIKESINQGTNSVGADDSLVLLSADVTNNNAVANSIQEVTGLSFPVVNGTRYWFEFEIRYTAAATTTGSRWTISGPATSELTYSSEYSLTATSRTFNEGVTAYDLPAASSASSASVAGNIARIYGTIRPSADGSVIARFASEVANSAIVAKAGSIVRFRAV